MKGRFDNCYFVGRTEDASKSKKFKYIFVEGTKTDKGIMNPTAVEFWVDQKFDFLEFMKPYPMVLDVQGEFVSFVEFVKKQA